MREQTTPQAGAPRLVPATRMLVMAGAGALAVAVILLVTVVFPVGVWIVESPSLFASPGLLARPYGRRQPLRLPLT